MIFVVPESLLIIWFLSFLVISLPHLYQNIFVTCLSKQQIRKIKIPASFTTTTSFVKVTALAIRSVTALSIYWVNSMRFSRIREKNAC